MSNLEVVRALHRSMDYYFNTPTFSMHGRSLRDFLRVASMAIGALFLMFFVLVLFINDGGDMTGIGNCGLAESIDQ